MSKLRRILKWYRCRKYGICPVHNVLRPHGGYNQGTWGICPKCSEENQGKNIMRNARYEADRNAALEAIDRDWRTR